jgi:hypothetical protein
MAAVAVVQVEQELMHHQQLPYLLEVLVEMVEQILGLMDHQIQ